MKLKPFFTYFGGKYRSAPKYPEPHNEVIIEPFAGSAGYSLRYPERKIILNDLDPLIAETWRYLIGATEAEIMSLPLWDGSWQTTDELTHLSQEERWLIGWWLHKGGTGGRKTPSTWMKSGTNHKSYWGPEIRERIAYQLPAIRHWEVTSQHFRDIPNQCATWFIDPPYQSAGREYRIRDVDFAELGDWCKSRDGQVLVCENEGATWLPFEPFAEIKAAPGKCRSGFSREALWVSERKELK